MGLGVTLSLDGITTNNINKIKTTRENKGKSLLEFPNNYVILDIETTGLSPVYNEIIEISAIRIENNQIISEFSELVKPEEEISDFITKLTGITNEMVKDSKKIKEVLKQFKNFIEKDDILSGYNVNFDINFLYDNFKENLNIDFSNDFVDVMRIAKRALKGELDSFKLKKLAKYYSISIENMHRGLNDCKITFEIFKQLNNDIIKNFGSYDNFKEIKYHRSLSINVNDIVPVNNNFNVEHPCYNNSFVFTGALKKLTRKEAMQLAVDFGGIISPGVNKKTNYLVIGTLDYSKTVAGNKSSKIIKAENLKLKGQDIEIISEDVFYDMFEGFQIESQSQLKKQSSSRERRKSEILMICQNHDLETIKDILSYVRGKLLEISTEDKNQILEECIKEELIEIQDIKITKYKFFEKMKVKELKSILNKFDLDTSEGTKKPLINRIIENVDLQDYNFKPIYILTNKGYEFRENIK